MRPSPRQINIVLVLFACIVLPPLLGKSLPGLFNLPRTEMISIALCYAAGAMSLNILMGYAGQISLGQGALLGVGAIASGIVTSRGLELPLPFGLVASALAGGAIAFVIGLPALRLRGLYLAIATIGFAWMMEESFFKWNPITRGSSGVRLPRNLLGPVELDAWQYLSIVATVFVVMYLVDVNIVRSKLGRAFHGIREDESVAQSFGVDVTKYKLTAFVLSGAFAGLSGALYGHIFRLVNSESFSYMLPPQWSLLLVILVVVGGLGHRRSIVIAGILFAVTPRIFKFIEGWDLIVGSLLLVYTIARHPGGFAEAAREAKDAKLKKLTAGARPQDPITPSLPRPAVRATRSLTDPLLEVSEVTVAFGGLVAVNSASFSVPTGKIVGLIGPNGAGKSTLFNVISGFITPARGTVKFNGRDVGDLSPDQRADFGMGRTFQLIGLAKSLSVLENFLLAQHSLVGYGTAAALTFLPRVASMERQIEERAREAVDRLGFARYIDTPVKNLSHGQQRIVELGCALMTAPDLLLLDEPSAGFSPAAVENLTDRLREIRDEMGKTIVLVEHNIPMVLDLCDFIYVLNFGEVLASGTPHQITAHPEVIAAYLGESELESI